jgi:hypothetical protein
MVQRRSVLRRRGFQPAFLFIAFGFDCPQETFSLPDDEIIPLLLPDNAAQAHPQAGKVALSAGFKATWGTIPGDNQRSTCPPFRLIHRVPAAVISKWDERDLGFGCYEIRKREMPVATATVMAEQSFVRSQSVVARMVGGETLIVPVRAKVGDLASIYSFNGTGSLIWKLLESPKSVAELSIAMAEEYEVDRAQAEHDVTDFVNDMKAVGLVEVRASVAMAGD